MNSKLTVSRNFNNDYEFKAWVINNLNILQQIGPDLIQDTIEIIEDGFIVKTEILDQTIFVKCDREKSRFEDLGLIISICSQCNAQGVIWVTSNINDELKYAFNWLGERMGDDFEVYLIEIEIKNTSK